MRLVENFVLTGNQDTIYTAEASTRVIVTKLTVTNNNAAQVSITVYLVASGDTPGPDNVISNLITIQAGATYTFPEVVGHILEEGDFIVVQSSSPDPAVAMASGYVYQ